MLERIMTDMIAKGRDMPQGRTVLERCDVSHLIGLSVTVCHAAEHLVDDDGETLLIVPDLMQLTASAVVARCLMPIRLLGREMRAMRHAMGLTASELAELMGETARETLLRCETEKQNLGGYAEKVFRLVVCDALHEQAVGVDYHDGMIAKLKVCDPGKSESDFKIPEMEFTRVKVKKTGDDSPLVDGWYDSGRKAA
jgi:DNA-binding transcriptional regulator YiaG